MSKQKKLIIISSIVIILCVVISIVLIKNHTKNKSPLGDLNNIEDQKVLKATKVEGLLISDIIIDNSKTLKNYKAKVTNTTSKKYHIDKLEVTFIFEDNEYTIVALSNVDIEPNKEKYINIDTEEDLSKLTKINYSIDSVDKTTNEVAY